MELSRIGANRKEVKMKAFSDKEPNISFDSQTGNLMLLVEGVRNFV